MSRVLVVCAANICRSPAAAALLQRSLDSRGWTGTVESAGVTAAGGRGACDLALALVGEYAHGEYGFRDDAATVLARHRSRAITEHLVADADLVLVMEPWQVEAVEAMGTGTAVRMLGEDPIPDPHAIGYQAHPLVFEQLRAAVLARADQIAAAAQADPADQPRSSA